MNAVLISTYELGRQPFGLASPAAWLRRADVEVEVFDVSRQPLDEDAVRAADLLAFYVPMHTATRLAVQLLEQVRKLNPRAHVCFYGLYAPVNEEYLRGLGVQSILGGEFEEGLVALAKRLRRSGPECPPDSHEGPDAHRGVTSVGEQPEPVISLARQQFVAPDRTGLPRLNHYAHLVMPGAEHRTVGYTEASRGCKHLCRHCPIVPVYHGVFRVVQPEVVLTDVRQQVQNGAQHITFGDPDFFNGPEHAIRIVRALQKEFPQLTYDVTIKVEHLLKHANYIRVLRETGCLFVTSAVESVNDAVLRRLDKGHTRADFLRLAKRMRDEGMPLQPTFVPFTPWTVPADYLDLLEVVAAQDLVEAVAPIQFAIRLLIPAGSRLMELPEVRELVGPFAVTALVYPWKHPDTRMDELCEEVQGIVRSGEKRKRSRARTFASIWEAAARLTALPGEDTKPAELSLAAMPALAAGATIPYLNEPWYC